MTTDKRKAELEFGVDATGARAGLNEVKKEARETAQVVAQAGRDGAKGLDEIGAGARKASDTLTREEARMAAAIQRTTQNFQMMGKTASEKLAFRIDTKGLEPEKFEPALQRLRELEAGAKRTGVSAAQTAAALRGVPAQFTDIFVSLQSGQQPLTVLLQQGGQLKDMFGGVGAASRALGGYVLSLVSPLTVAAAAAGALGVAFYQGYQEAQAYRTQLILTGNAAGTTAGQLAAMAANTDSAIGTQGKAADVLAQLASTGRVARDQLSGAKDAILAMNDATGASVKTMVDDFASLGKAPVDAVVKLDERYRFLTLAVYEQIAALDKQGRTDEAVALAQNALAETIKGRADAIKENLGYLEVAWDGVGKAASWAWDRMKGLGREDTLETEIAGLEARRDRFRRLGGQTYGTSRQDVLNDYNLKIGNLRRQMLEEGAAAAREAAQRRIEESGIAAAREVEAQRASYAKGQEKIETELRKHRANLDKIRAANPSSPLLDPARVAADEAAIRDRFTDKSRRATAANVDETASILGKVEAERQYLQQLRELGSEAEKLNEGEKLVLQLQEKLKVAKTDVAKAELEKQLAAAKSLATTQRQIAVEKEAIKQRQDFETARTREGTRQDGEISQIEAKAQALEDEVAAYGLGKAAVEAMTLARLEERRAILAGFEGSAAAVEQLDREIAARKRLATVMNEKEVLEAGTKAAKEAEKEWARSASEIERSITDSLMRGFDSGKGFAENLRDTVVNMFKTLVLRPTVEAIVQPVAGAIAGQGGGGASSLLGSINSISSIYSAFTGGLSSSLASGIGALGSTFGIEAFSSFAAGMKGATLVSGLAGPTTVGASGAMGLGASFGSGLGTAMPYIGAVMLAYSALDALGVFKGATYHTGSAVGINADGSNTGRLGVKATFADQWVWGGFTEVDKRGGAVYADPLINIGTGIVGAINDTLKTFGKQTGVTAFAAYGADGDDASEGTLRIYGVDGQVLAGTSRSKYSSDPQKGFEQYLSEAGRIARDALLATDVPGWAKSILSELGSAPELSTVTQAVASINAGQKSLVYLGETFEQFESLSDAAVTSMISLFGSIDGVMASTSSFVELYYSDSEKVSLSVAAMRDALEGVNLTLPGTKDEFRALAEGLDLNTESGRKAYAVLMGISGQFASTADTAAQMAEAATQSIKQMSRGIEAEIDRLTGLGSGSGVTTAAALQAQFAVATAKARAGDEAAIEALPGLSQALLEASRTQASSSVEVARMQARTLASLEETLRLINERAQGPTGIAGFASGGWFSGGMRIVGERGPELELTGASRIFDAATTRQILRGGSDDGAVSELLRQVLATLERLRDEQTRGDVALARNTRELVNRFDRVIGGGESLSVTVTT